MNEKNFIPTLRFKDFDGTWDVIKLSSISKINKGNQLNKQDMVDNGEFYVLNGGKEPSGYTNSWNTPENTITISEGGNSCGYVNFNIEKFWSGGHCYYLSEVSKQIDIYYLFSYLKFLEPKIMRLRVGSGLPNIQKGDIENIQVIIPNVAEQNKISDYLFKLDCKINLLRNKQEKFLDLKMYLMQQIFEQDSKIDYNLIKLKKITNINKGEQLNKQDMVDNGEFYVLNGGKEPSGYTNSWNTPENTITISEGGNSCGYVNFNIEKFWSGGHCYYLSEVSKQIDIYYLFSYLKFLEPKIMRLRVGSGLPNIQKGDIENINIKLISLEEQSKISNLLLSLDKRISLINAQKENFENFKKGLLQQMLIELK